MSGGDIFSKIVILIPAYNPDEKMIKTVEELRSTGFKKVIIVNDGSSEKSADIFKTVSDMCISDTESDKSFEVDIIEHTVNLGQGRAFKTGFNFYLKKYSNMAGVVECDADGQHHIEDITRCAELLLENPDSFILGVRNFKRGGVPLRSRFGNECTNLVFRLFCGMDIRDTQTGLKGVPTELIYRLIEAPGERYEYATSVLLEVHKAKVPIIQFDIRTIYIDNNASSHFNPLVDSQCHLVNQFQIKIQWFSFRESHCFFSSKT